jgi:phosphoribosyl 1,2-cyclic phosphodiesterase
LPTVGNIDVRHFRSGASVRIGHLTVETIATPHDATDGVVFVVDDGRHRLGICTDVGHVFGELKNLAGGVDALFLESNFDETMLARGPYPRRLKERIRGPGGHISNREAAELVANHAGDRLQWLCLAHLSHQNNSPGLALAAHREALGDSLPIHIASRSRASGALTLGERPVGSGEVRRQLVFDF